MASLKNRPFTNREFYGKLASLVIPIAFQSFMVAIVNASDALMLARLDQTSLSAVSLATQISFVASLFLFAFNTGVSIFAAQYWGKNDIDSIEKIFAYVVKISSSIAFIFSFFSFFFPELLMKIYTKDSLIIEKGVIYLKIVSPTYLFAGISQIYLCILKNSEHAVISTAISSVCVGLNIILNALFIYGLLGVPRLEIAGAALATLIARFVELSWALIETARPGRVKFRLKYFFKIEKVFRMDFWKYSYPVLLSNVSWGVAFSMYSVIMGHLGSDAVAANSISNIVKNLVCCMSSGLAAGAGIMIGNELGRENFEKARAYGSKFCHIALLNGVLMGGIIILLIPIVLKNVSMSEEALRFLKLMLFICSYNMIGKSINCVTNCGIFPAGADSKFCMICDTISMWCVSVPAGFLSAFVFNAPVLVVYFILNLDEILKLPAIYLYYKKYHWLKNITRS